MQNLGLLGGIGQQQQGLQQQGLGAARGEFNRALGYGQQQLGLLQGGMGTPLIGSSDYSKQKTGPGDIISSVFGLFS
jgi:hypothetical protein